jgi:ribosomal protein L37AE/L43A
MTSPERAVPYYCPYCGGEDLRPHEDRHGAWECRECTRVFSVSMLGMRVGPGPEASSPQASNAEGVLR